MYLWNHVTKVGIDEPSIELPPDALSPEHTKQMGHYVHTEEGTENTYSMLYRQNTPRQSRVTD